MPYPLLQKEFAIVKRSLVAALLLALLSACATPRGAPICKGPYTPINPPNAVPADGTQPHG